MPETTTTAAPIPEPKFVDNESFLKATGSLESNLPGDINIMRYPQDLGGDHLPHSLLFFVNIRKTDLGAGEVATTGAQKIVSTEQTTQNRPMSTVKQTRKLVTVATPIILYKMGAAVGKQLDSFTMGTGVLEAAMGIGGAAFGFGLAVGGVANAIIPEKTITETESVIALYTSGPQMVSYQASWSEEDLGFVAGLARTLGDTGNIRGGMEYALKNIGGAAAALALKANDKDTTFGNLGASIKAGARVTPNPFKAQLFTSMGFRKFSFEYVFLPRNEWEYKQCRGIIKTFKRNMHPEFSEDKYITHYPPEWNIVHFYKGVRNTELFRIANCALTDLKITYGGGSDFSTFARPINDGKDGLHYGAPTEMKVHLEFIELELLTKSRVDEGF